MMTDTGFSSNASSEFGGGLDPAGVQAILAEFISASLGLSWLERADLTPDRLIEPEDLGVDSLHLLELAGQVNTFFMLHEIGNEDNLLRRRSIASWTNTVMTALAQPEHPGLTLETSGSTGHPVNHHFCWSQLDQELEVLASLFADRRRVVQMVPPDHIYGLLFTKLLPRRLEVGVEDLRSPSPERFLRGLRPGDLVVSFPLRWRQLLGPSTDFCDDVVGVTSTGPCPAETAEGLAAKGLTRLVDVYGSTETGGIGWRDDPDDAYDLFPYWSFDNGGGLKRQRLDGESVQVAAPDRLTTSGSHFRIAGRRDHAVQVAGTNVWPSKVTAALAEHPSIAACAVRLMRPDEGERLKAFVVPANEVDPEELRPKLHKWMAKTFASAERPAVVSFGSALPVDAQGKDSDWILGQV